MRESHKRTGAAQGAPRCRPFRARHRRHPHDPPLVFCHMLTAKGKGGPNLATALPKCRQYSADGLAHQWTEQRMVPTAIPLQ
jgi:hypothetical protein